MLLQLQTGRTQFCFLGFFLLVCFLFCFYECIFDGEHFEFTKFIVVDIETIKFLELN